MTLDYISLEIYLLEIKVLIRQIDSFFHELKSSAIISRVLARAPQTTRTGNVRSSGYPLTEKAQGQNPV